MLLVIIELLLIAFLIYRIYRIVKGYRAISRASELSPMDMMREALYPMLGKGAVAEMVISELSVFYYGIIVWFKKPQLPHSGYFTYHQTSQYKMIMIVFIILIAAETVGMHFLLRIWSDWLAWGATVLSIYAILYLIASFNAYRYLPHLLNAEGLHVRMGFQSSVFVEHANIDRLTAGKQFGLGETAPPFLYISHIRMDAPQFEVHLKQPIPMRVLFGKKKEISSIMLRVDKPNEFEAELKRLQRIV